MGGPGAAVQGPLKENLKTVKFRYLGEGVTKRSRPCIKRLRSNSTFNLCLRAMDEETRVETIIQYVCMFYRLRKYAVLDLISRFLSKQDDLDIFQNVRKICVDSSKISLAASLLPESFMMRTKGGREGVIPQCFTRSARWFIAWTN